MGFYDIYLGKLTANIPYLTEYKQNSIQCFNTEIHVIVQYCTMDLVKTFQISSNDMSDYII